MGRKKKTFLTVFCYIPLYFLAVSLFPNNATLTGGGREARCAGRVRCQQSETQISQQRTGDELKLTTLAAESSRALQADRARKNCRYWNNTCGNRVTANPSESLRGEKAPKEEPVHSKQTWSDLMTPEQDDLGWLQKPPGARSHSPAVGDPGSKTGNMWSLNT